MQCWRSDVRHRPPWAKIKCWQGSLLLEVLEERPSPGLSSLQRPLAFLGSWPLPPASKQQHWISVPFFRSHISPDSFLPLSSNCKDPCAYTGPTWRIQDCLPRLHQLMRDLGSICKHNSPLPLEVLDIGYRFFSLGSCYPSNYTA